MALPVYGDYPPPPGYVLESKVNRGLFYGGLVTFAATYGVGVLYGGANGFEQGLGWTAVPLIGPWVAISQRDFTCETTTNPLDPEATQAAADACQQKTVSDATAVAVLAGLGVGQLLGATLTTVGALDRRKRWVRADLLGMPLRFDGFVGPSFAHVRLSGAF